MGITDHERLESELVAGRDSILSPLSGGGINNSKSSRKLFIGRPKFLFRCLFDIEFLFNGILYKQHGDVVIGSLLDPLSSEAFRAKTERTRL